MDSTKAIKSHSVQSLSSSNSVAMFRCRGTMAHHAHNYQDLLVHCKPLWLWHVSCDDACWKLALFQELGQVLGTRCILHKDDHLQFAQLSQVTSNLYRRGFQWLLSTKAGWQS